MSDSTRLTDDEARAVWRRAAELQAAAEHASQRGRALARVQHGELSLDHVTEAARGAGISPEFVNLALAEQRLPDAHALGHETWKVRWLQRMVGGAHVIERQRFIAADPAAVLAAFRRVATSGAYALIPESVIGGDPLQAAVLVYRIVHSTTFGTTMNFADARVLLVTVRPHEDGATLRVRVPLFRRGVNLTVGSAAGSLVGAGGGVLGGAVASTLGATAFLVAVPAAAGVVAGGAVGIAAFRALYRAGIRGGERAVDSLLQATAMEAETEGR